jgi:hypothetical protein
MQSPHTTFDIREFAMPDHQAPTRTNFVELIAWCIAAPILTVWALVSLLPIVSLIRAWGDAGEASVALAFLATGAVGFVAAAVGYRLLLWNTTKTPVASSETRTMRAVALAAYALVWMAFYAL